MWQTAEQLQQPQYCSPIHIATLTNSLVYIAHIHILNVQPKAFPQRKLSPSKDQVITVSCVNKHRRHCFPQLLPILSLTTDCCCWQQWEHEHNYSALHSPKCCLQYLLKQIQYEPQHAYLQTAIVFNKLFWHTHLDDSTQNPNKKEI